MKNKDVKTEDEFLLDQREEIQIYLYLNYLRNEENQIYLFINYIEGMKTNQSICSSTIKGTKTKRGIRSSTIDDLTLLLPIRRHIKM